MYDIFNKLNITLTKLQISKNKYSYISRPAGTTSGLTPITTKPEPDGEGHSYCWPPKQLQSKPN